MIIVASSPAETTVCSGETWRVERCDAPEPDLADFPSTGGTPTGSAFRAGLFALVVRGLVSMILDLSRNVMRMGKVPPKLRSATETGLPESPTSRLPVISTPSAHPIATDFPPGNLPFQFPIAFRLSAVTYVYANVSLNSSRKFSWNLHCMKNH